MSTRQAAKVYQVASPLFSLAETELTDTTRGYAVGPLSTDYSLKPSSASLMEKGEELFPW